jgi:hypothetical protein
MPAPIYEACEALKKLGMSPAIEWGRPVTEAELDELDRKTDFPMPVELRQFYLEMGDAFWFKPDGDNEELSGWDPAHLGDYEINNRGFGDSLEDDVHRFLSHPNCRADRASLLAEVEKRKRWIPCYDFIGNGSVLCIDGNTGAIRYHESICWDSCPDTWDFNIAPSFTDFVKRWSKFHFVCPSSCGWNSFCDGLTGTFDWDPKHFILGRASRPQ